MNKPVKTFEMDLTLQQWMQVEEHIDGSRAMLAFQPRAYRGTIKVSVVPQRLAHSIKKVIAAYHSARKPAKSPKR